MDIDISRVAANPVVQSVLLSQEEDLNRQEVLEVALNCEAIPYSLHENYGQLFRFALGYLYKLSAEQILSQPESRAKELTILMR